MLAAENSSRPPGSFRFLRHTHSRSPHRDNHPALCNPNRIIERRTILAAPRVLGQNYALPLSRSHLPRLVASDDGYIVNISSVNGFWACLGPNTAHTAYSSAKFAVKGFSEALLVDLRLHAPHVKVAVVMPGHVGTSIVINTNKVLGKPEVLEMRPEDVALVRALLLTRGVPVGDMTDDQIKAVMHQLALSFRDDAPLTAAQAATIILDGVRRDAWRILVGDDAHALDRMVRESPEAAYENSFMQALQQQGHMLWGF